MRTTVYGLCDPATAELRYIGITVHRVSLRFAQHKHEALRGRDNSRKNNWFASVLRTGAEPSIFVIEEVDGNGFEDECFYIEYFRSLGCRLTNTAPGGEGRRGQLPEITKARIGAALRGKRQDPAFVARRTRNAKGRKHTEATLKKLRDFQSNRPPITSATKSKIANSMRGRKQSASSVALRAAAQRGKPFSDVRRKNISEGKRRARFFKLLKQSSVDHALASDYGDLLKVNTP